MPYGILFRKSCPMDGTHRQEYPLTNTRIGVKFDGGYQTPGESDVVWRISWETSRGVVWL